MSFFTTRRLIYFFAIIAAIGLIDAIYLAVAYFTGIPLACSVLDGCNVVAASPYSKLLGVPLAYFGVLYYLGAIAFAGFLIWQKEFIWPYRWAVVLFTVIGALFSVYFEYLQLGPIGAICIYCQISAFATWALAAIGFLLWRLDTPQKDTAGQDSVPPVVS